MIQVLKCLDPHSRSLQVSFDKSPARTRFEIALKFKGSAFIRKRDIGFYPQGLNLAVCGTSPELCFSRRVFKSPVMPRYIRISSLDDRAIADGKQL
jgi:hypothetical protein